MVQAILLRRLSAGGTAAGVACEVEAQNDKGETALLLACMRGHTEVLRQLLLSPGGVEGVNVCDHYGNSPMLLASSGPHAGVVEALLAVSGCDVNLPNQYGCTPVGVAAAKEGGEAVIKALLAAHADPNHADGEGETPLMIAAKEGVESVVEVLLAVPGINVDALNVQGLSAVMLATSEGQEATATALSRHGARDVSPPSSPTGRGGATLWI